MFTQIRCKAVTACVCEIFPFCFFCSLFCHIFWLTLWSLSPPHPKLPGWNHCCEASRKGLCCKPECSLAVSSSPLWGACRAQLAAQNSPFSWRVVEKENKHTPRLHQPNCRYRSICQQSLLNTGLTHFLSEIMLAGLKSAGLITSSHYICAR